MTDFYALMFQLIELGKLDSTWQVKLLGIHNLENIKLAVTAARLLKIPESIIKHVVENFSGVPGRLELVREHKGIKYYNDTTATMPEATLAALQAFSQRTDPPREENPKSEILNPRLQTRQAKQIQNSKLESNKNIILIGGGNDKNLDYKKYAEVVTRSVKKLILFPGAATDKIKKLLPKNFKKNIINANSMKEALKQAVACSGKGDIVLLSPGATSFGLFKNEYDRGDQFVDLVKKLK